MRAKKTLQAGALAADAGEAVPGLRVVATEASTDFAGSSLPTR